MSINLEVVIAAIVAATPGIILAIVALRKQPSETRSVEAATDKAQHEAGKALAESAKSLAESLGVEVTSLRLEVASLRAELAGAVAKTNAAEKRATEFRTELIRVGTMLDEARKEHTCQINELVLIIETLIDQIAGLGGKPKVDRAVLDRLASLGQDTQERKGR